MELFNADCLEVLKNTKDESVDLIYLDPPFFTQKIHYLSTRDGNQDFEFSDKWDSLSSYMLFINERLVEMKRVLKTTGSIFFHCDKNASHHIRIMLDQVFGESQFRNEIVWTYRRWSSSTNTLQNCHQNIFFYSKGPNYKFHKIYTDYSPTTNIDQILQSRKRDESGKSTYKKDELGNVVSGGEKKGVPLSDVWEIPFLNPKANERVGYPTQKPIMLLERIIELVTDEGDTVLDPFCGSGTTLVAAKLMNRKYIGIDISFSAIQLTEQRLNHIVKTRSMLVEKGKNTFYNKNRKESIILEIINAIPVQRNTGIDGFLKQHYLGAPVAVKIQKETESFEEGVAKLLKASNIKGCSLSIFIKTRGESIQNHSKTPENLIIIDSMDLVVYTSLTDKVKLSGT